MFGLKPPEPPKEEEVVPKRTSVMPLKGLLRMLTSVKRPGDEDMVTTPMKQWRVLLYFDCLTDFKLSSLSRLTSHVMNDSSTIEHPKLPSCFFMHVSVFKQSFTFPVQTPLMRMRKMAANFTEAV